MITLTQYLKRTPLLIKRDSNNYFISVWPQTLVTMKHIGIIG